MDDLAREEKIGTLLANIDSFYYSVTELDKNNICYEECPEFFAKRKATLHLVCSNLSSFICSTDISRELITNNLTTLLTTSILSKKEFDDLYVLFNEALELYYLNS